MLATTLAIARERIVWSDATPKNKWSKTQTHVLFCIYGQQASHNPPTSWPKTQTHMCSFAYMAKYIAVKTNMPVCATVSKESHYSSLLIFEFAYAQGRAFHRWVHFTQTWAVPSHLVFCLCLCKIKPLVRVRKSNTFELSMNEAF